MQDAAKSLAATMLGHLVNDGSLYVFPLVYGLLIKSYGLSLGLVAVLASLTSLFAIVASPFIGRKSDTSQNYGLLMAFGILLMAASIFGYAISFVYFRGNLLFDVLIPLTFVLGLGSSFYHPLAAAILNEKWDQARRGQAMGVNGAMGSLGATIYPIITVALVASLSLPAISIIGVWSVAAAFIILALMRSFRFSSAGLVEEYQRQRPSPKPKRPAVSFRLVLPRISALTAVSFVRGLSQGIVSLLPTFLVFDRHLSFFNAGILFSAMLALGTLGQPLFGYLSDRLGRRLALGMSGAGCVVSMLLFLWTSNSIVAEASLGAFGLFNYTSFPLLMGLSTEIAPQGATTISSSIVWGLGNIGGGAVGPILAAALALPIALGSLTGAFYVIALVGILSAVLVPLVPKPSDRGEEKLIKQEDSEEEAGQQQTG